MKKKIVSLMLAVTMTASALTACGSSETGSKTSSSYQDELHVAIGKNPSTLDTMKDTSYIPRVITYGNIFEALVSLTEDYSWKPELAESVDINDDYTEYTYHLRKGVKFHNGEEMQADDVAASMNRWVECYGNAKSMVGDARFETVDDYTVSITLSQSTLFLNELIATQSCGSVIMPKEVVEDLDESGYVKEYIGTGPYKFVEWKDDQYIKFERFDDYTNYAEEGERDGWWGYKEAPTKYVYYDIVTDSQTRTSGMQTGLYDIAYEMPTENYNLFEGDEFKIYKESFGSFQFVYNKKEGLCKDPLIRQAVNAIIDPEEVLLAAYLSEDFYSVSTSYMMADMKTWYSDKGAENAHKKDAELAKSYLEQAGYDGEAIRILTNSDSVIFTNAAVVLQQELESIGMKTEIVSVDSSTFISYRSDSEKYDVFVNYSMPVSIPTLQIFLSPTWPGFTTDEKVLSMVNEINSCVSLDDAVEKWNELQEYCWTDSLPITKLGDVYSYNVVASGVEGYDQFSGPIVVNIKVKE